jgi:hypothetical protein
MSARLLRFALRNGSGTYSQGLHIAFTEHFTAQNKLVRKGVPMATTSPSLMEKSVSGRQFAAAIEAIKAVHVILASVMTDLAALRRAVLEDADFAESYAKHLREATDTARPLVAEAIEHYDEMISLEQENGEFDN